MIISCIHFLILITVFVNDTKEFKRKMQQLGENLNKITQGTETSKTKWMHQEFSPERSFFKRTDELLLPWPINDYKVIKND